MARNDGTESEALPAKTLPEERKDFVKRLFAVTISVGFATQIAHIIPQLDQSAGVWHMLTSMSAQQLQELGLLLASLVAVVASWEGYLKSISLDPLESRTRFYLDIVIVFVYLLLLLFSQKSDLWFATLAMMFVIYAAWDMVKIRDRAVKAKREHTTIAPVPLSQHGATITGLWLIVVVALYYFKAIGTERGFFFALLAALCVIVMYRFDKDQKPGWLGKVLLVSVPTLLIFLSARFH
jgi:hypothetical protein